MAQAIIVLVDGDACVPDRIREDLGILTAPLAPAAFDPAEEPRELRRSAAPVEGEEATAALARARELAPAVLYLGVGDGYGGSETALAAASTTPGVLAIATGEALMGGGWQAIAAAVVARSGGSLDDAERAAAAVRGRTRVLMMLEHPPFAGVSGGVPGVLFGSRALVRLSGPTVDVVARFGRRDAALVGLRERFALEVQEGGSGTSGGGALRVAVHHAGAAAAAEAMALWVERTLHPEEVVVAPLTRHAASRLGPGVVGVAWYREGTIGTGG
ncbi:MAG: hypothetical protein DWI59_03015 [Chloroflexi bacterium]|nr:MAG: hypothetical protein DWI59_03015 [Chloroflexota bacterium]